MITKAIILARGLGTRMRAGNDAAALSAEQARAADAGMKAMIPIGRPFLDYVLRALADAGISDVCLVIGPEHDAIRRYYAEEVRPVRSRCTSPCSRSRVGGRCRALGAGVRRRRAISRAERRQLLPGGRLSRAGERRRAFTPGFDRAALVRLGNVDAERIRKYALLRVGDDGVLQHIVEKPDEATFAAMGPHALVSMNLWAFTHEIFAACERVEPSARGEVDIPNAVRLAVREMGMRFRVIPMVEPVLDLSSRGDVASMASAPSGFEVRL